LNLTIKDNRDKKEFIEITIEILQKKFVVQANPLTVHARMFCSDYI